MFKTFQTYIAIVLGFLVYSFTSCTKNLDLHNGNTERQLIINCTFDVNSPFSVKLITSRNILDPDSKNEIVNDAYVAIKDGEGKLLEVLSERNDGGIYRSSQQLTAFPGKTYSLEVTHPRWKGTVFTATSTVPELGSGSDLDTNLVFLDDGPALEISAVIYDGNEMGDRYIFQVELEKNQLAPLLSFGNELTVYGDQDLPKRLFIDDEKFNGQKKDLAFVTKNGVPGDISTGPATIKMVNASKELYEYYKSLEEYGVAQNSIGSVNTSAVRIYSNIKQSGVNKGFGIFAGLNSKSLKIIP